MVATFTRIFYQTGQLYTHPASLVKFSYITQTSWKFTSLHSKWLYRLHFATVYHNFVILSLLDAAFAFEIHAQRCFCFSHSTNGDIYSFSFLFLSSFMAKRCMWYIFRLLTVFPRCFLFSFCKTDASCLTW